MIRYERDAASGDLLAVSTVRVGVEVREERVRVGPWEGPDPDPAGLFQTPAIVLPDGSNLELARAGALRSGDQPPVLILPGDVPSPALQLVVAVEQGVEVVLFSGGDGRLLNLVRALEGRPLPALPLDDLPACRAILEGCRVDLDIAVPSRGGAEREALRAALESLEPVGLGAHHLVEVDDSPAFDAAGLDRSGAGLAAATAAAAGVLSGRLAAANRRRRAQRP